jgi:hypothetical protein
MTSLRVSVLILASPLPRSLVVQIIHAKRREAEQLDEAQGLKTHQQRRCARL